MTSSRFVKANCNMDSQKLSMNFCALMWKSKGLSCPLNRSLFMHDLVTSVHVTWKTLASWVTQIHWSWPFHYTTFINTLNSVTTHLIRNLQVPGRCQGHSDEYNFSKIPTFTLEVQISSWVTNNVTYFPLNDRQTSAKDPSLSVSWCFRWKQCPVKTWAGQAAPPTPAEMLFLDTTPSAAMVLHVNLPLHHAD